MHLYICDTYLSICVFICSFSKAVSMGFVDIGESSRFSL